MSLGCVDTTEGNTDSDGDGCDYYEYNTNQCGEYDTTNFTANLMCCFCNVTGNFRYDNIH